MYREKLHYCKGNDEEKESANDNLELLLEDIRLREEPDDFVTTYFLPKLTEDVSKAEMTLSKSK